MVEQEVRTTHVLNTLAENYEPGESAHVSLIIHLQFMELFKILKFDVPQFIKDLLKFCSKNKKLRLIPYLRLDISQQNFLLYSPLIHDVNPSQLARRGLVVISPI